MADPALHRHKNIKGQWATGVDGGHTHPPEFTAAEVIALKALAAAGSGGGTPVPTPEPPPIIVPPPPSGNIYDFPSGGTRAQFQTKCADLTIDGIRLSNSFSWSPAAGHSGLLNLRVNRAARPLTIIPADGVTVEIDGNGASSFMRFGAATDSGATDEGTSLPSHACSDITIDARGTGTLRLKNFAIGHDGLFYGDWMERIRVLGLEMRSITGSGGSFSHLFYSGNYTGAPAGRRSKDLEFSYNDIRLTDKTVNGVQTFHDDNVNGLDVIGNYAEYLNTFAYVYSNPLNVLFDGNVLDHINKAFEGAQTPSAIVKNTTVTNRVNASTGFPPLTDGGGNTGL